MIKQNIATEERERERERIGHCGKVVIVTRKLNSISR